MITVRTAGAHDVPRILEIMRASISPVWTKTTIQSELEKNDSLFLVAIAGGIVAGFAVVRQVGDDGELLQIAACSSSRRVGVGNTLMCAILNYATEKNYEAMHLEVRSGNIAAIKLYEKHGFIKVRVRKDYYDAPLEDAIVMVRNMLV